MVQLKDTLYLMFSASPTLVTLSVIALVVTLYAVIAVAQPSAQPTSAPTLAPTVIPVPSYLPKADVTPVPKSALPESP